MLFRLGSVPDTPEKLLRRAVDFADGGTFGGALDAVGGAADICAVFGIAAEAREFPLRASAVVTLLGQSSEHEAFVAERALVAGSAGAFFVKMARALFGARSL